LTPKVEGLAEGLKDLSHQVAECSNSANRNNANYINVVRAHNQLTNNHNYHDNLLHRKVIPGMKRLSIGAKVADRRGRRLNTKLQVMNGKLRALEEKMQVQAEVMKLQDESTAMMQEEYDILRFEVKEAGKREAVLNSVVKSLANELDTLKASIAAGSSSSSGSRDSALTVMMMAKMEQHEDVLRAIREQAALQRADYDAKASIVFRHWGEVGETARHQMNLAIQGSRTTADQASNMAAFCFHKFVQGQLVSHGDMMIRTSLLAGPMSAMTYVEQQLEFFLRRMAEAGMVAPGLLGIMR
jgi:hypothetical protein